MTAKSSLKGKIVRRWTWKDTTPPDFSWNGKNEEGKTVADGTYSYTLVGEDRAGNTSRERVEGIVLSTATHTLSMRPSYTAFSPNGDGVRDTITFSVQAPVERSIESWTLTVLDKDGEPVHTCTGEGAVEHLLAQSCPYILIGQGDRETFQSHNE